MRIGEFLVQKEAIKEQELKKALIEQKMNGKKIGEVLVDLNLITEKELMESLSGMTTFPFIELGVDDVDYSIFKKYNNLVKGYDFIPFKETEEELKIACYDFKDDIMFAVLKEVCGKRLSVNLITNSNLKKLYAHNPQLKEIKKDYLSKSRNRLTDLFNNTDTTQITYRLIEEVIDLNATYLALTPGRENLAVEFISGYDTIHISEISIEEGRKIVQLLKNRCDLLDKKPKQQEKEEIKKSIKEGYTLVTTDKYKDIGLVVTLIPTINGERLIIKVINKYKKVIKLGDFGFDSDTISDYNNIITQKSGLVLVTGPLGNGKSSLLYSTLDYITSTTRKRIMTVEEDVELDLSSTYGYNIIQTEIRDMKTPKSDVLRSIIKQRPEIVVISDISDVEVARVALHLASKGILVIAGVVSNSIYECLETMRLAQVDFKTLASVLKGIVNMKRLLKLCQDCKVKEEGEEVVEFEGKTYELNHNVSIGCDTCRKKGYRPYYYILDILPILDGESRKSIATLSNQFTETSCTGGADSRYNKCAMFNKGLSLTQRGLISVDELRKLL